MGILDEAIREHLALKRQHGAGDSELKQLEDEAFGQAERPGGETISDTAAEAPTAFMTQPEPAGEASGRRETPSIADLQEPPPGASGEEEPAAEPAAEEQTAREHEIVAEPAELEEEPEPATPSAAERRTIAEQPTEIHDVEEELAAEPPSSPTDEQLVEEEIAEPRLAPTDPFAGIDEEEAEVSVTGPAPDDDEQLEDEDDAFWNEQRLSDELDRALEGPRDDEPERAGEPESGPEEPEPAVEEPEPAVEEPEPTEDPAPRLAAEIEDDDEVQPIPDPDAPARPEDVLEDTPDFLEESPEDDQLWFEQRPPKDFDFDD